MRGRVVVSSFRTTHRISTGRRSTCCAWRLKFPGNVLQEPWLLRAPHLSPPSLHLELTGWAKSRRPLITPVQVLLLQALILRVCEGKGESHLMLLFPALFGLKSCRKLLTHLCCEKWCMIMSRDWASSLQRAACTRREGVKWKDDERWSS